MVSINGIFNRRDFGLFLFSEPHDEVPLSFEPSDSVIKFEIDTFIIVKIFIY